MDGVQPLPREPVPNRGGTGAGLEQLRACDHTMLARGKGDDQLVEMRAATVPVCRVRCSIATRMHDTGEVGSDGVTEKYASAPEACRVAQTSE